MSDLKPSGALGTDWTSILSDPDLVRHVGKLLQAYREAAPEKREEALLAAMREIKAQAAGDAKPVSAVKTSVKAKEEPAPRPVPTAVSDTPPFAPDVFSSNSGDDRRRYPRIKCFVAVELRVDNSETPIWGNLCNTSVGGCLVETATPLKSGAKVEVGLWVASGKIWVKGFALSGIVTRSAATTGVRVRFDNMEPAARNSLRQFLKYVQDTSRVSRSEDSYMQLLK